MPDRLPVREDPELTPEEKETLIGFAKSDDELRVHSEHAAIVRWLRDHPAYHEEGRRVKDGVLHATTGRLPVGAVKLSGHPRDNSRPSTVVGELPEAADD